MLQDNAKKKLKILIIQKIIYYLKY